MIEIIQPEAVQYLNSESELWHLMNESRTFDMTVNKWIGKEPVHIKPSGLPLCKAVNITLASDHSFDEFMENFFTPK